MRQDLADVRQDVGSSVTELRQEIERIRAIADDPSLDPAERDRLIAEAEARMGDRVDDMAGAVTDGLRSVADTIDRVEAKYGPPLETIATGAAGGDWQKILGGIIALLGTGVLGGRAYGRKVKEDAKREIAAERDASRPEAFAAYAAAAAAPIAGTALGGAIADPLHAERERAMMDLLRRTEALEAGTARPSTGGGAA